MIERVVGRLREPILRASLVEAPDVREVYKLAQSAPSSLTRGGPVRGAGQGRRSTRTRTSPGPVTARLTSRITRSGPSAATDPSSDRRANTQAGTGKRRIGRRDDADRVRDVEEPVRLGLSEREDRRGRRADDGADLGAAPARRAELLRQERRHDRHERRLVDEQSRRGRQARRPASHRRRRARGPSASPAMTATAGAIGIA